MSLENKYNLKSPGVKRLMREAQELARATEEYYACPLDDNLFEWHFTIRGPPSTEFEGGYYHGRILLPSQYPMQPPNIILLTPNGRFEVNKKICLSISGHHPETWQPSWSIRTALLALIAFMPTVAAGTIGSLDYTPDERRVLALRSKAWECPTCGRVAEKLENAGDVPAELTQEESTMIMQIALKAEEDANRKTETIITESNESELRQRTTDKSPDAEHPENSQSNPPVLVTNIEASNQRSTSDKIWTAIIWIIIIIIILLIIRRIFFS